jgi:hypothetical protein
MRKSGRQQRFLSLDSSRTQNRDLEMVTFNGDTSEALPFWKARGTQRTSIKIRQ